MDKKAIAKEIERIETAIFMEQMADFMNWGNYYKLKKELCAMREAYEKAID